MRIVNYFDDFLEIVDSFESCQLDQYRVIQLLRFLGLQISWSKVALAVQVTTYLSIEIDSVLMEFRLPFGKIEKLRTVLDKFSSKKLCQSTSLSSCMAFWLTVPQF